MEEDGGLNLYGFCSNNAVNKWDYLGMDDYLSQVPTYDALGNIIGFTWQSTGMTGQDLADASILAANNQNWLSYAEGAISGAMATKDSSAMGSNAVLGVDNNGNYIVASYTSPGYDALMNAVGSWETSTGSVGLIGLGAVNTSGDVSLSYFGVGAGTLTTVNADSNAPNSAASTTTNSGQNVATAVVAGTVIAAPGVLEGGGGITAGELIAGAARAGPLVAAGAVVMSIAGDSWRTPTQYVVRGGFASPQNLIAGTDYHKNVAGLYGFSVQSAPNVPVNELARAGNFFNGTISVSTVAKLGSVGALVTPSPGGGYHNTVVVPAPLSNTQAALISAQFQTGIPNPFPRPKR